MPKLTQKFVQKIEPPEAGQQLHWDEGNDSIAGFGLRVTAAGVKSFVLNYRVLGVQRRYTIGQLGTWTAETARQEARRLRTNVDRGEDPFAIDQQKKRIAQEEDARQRTLKELADYYLSSYADVHKRPRSVTEDRAMLDGIILPRLGRTRLSSIGSSDILELHASLKGTPYRANRVLTLLHKIFNIAVADTGGRWSVTQNAAAGVRKFQEHKRERWLSEEELRRLATALEQYPKVCSDGTDVSDKQKLYLLKEAERAVNAIRLIMVTGCRKGEALSAKWSDFDMVRRIWTKPSHHTKQNRTEHVPLGSQALSLLESLPRQGEYLFPGRTRVHLTDLKGPWARVCAMACLSGVRIHDLRHTFASHLVSSGVSLPLLGRLLGHTQPQTTARYAHVAQDPLREAANLFPKVL